MLEEREIESEVLEALRHSFAIAKETQRKASLSFGGMGLYNFLGPCDLIDMSPMLSHENWDSHHLFSIPEMTVVLIKFVFVGSSLNNVSS